MKVSFLTYAWKRAVHTSWIFVNPSKKDKKILACYKTRVQAATENPTRYQLCRVHKLLLLALYHFVICKYKTKMSFLIKIFWVLLGLPIGSPWILIINLYEEYKGVIFSLALIPSVTQPAGPIVNQSFSWLSIHCAMNVVWVGCMKKKKDGDDYCGLKSANSRPGTVSLVFSSHQSYTNMQYVWTHT